MSNSPIFIDTTQLTATDGVFRQHLEDQAKARELRDAQERLLGSNNRVAVRPKSAEEAGIRRQDARVEVREAYSPERQDKCIEVAVYSLMRPGAFHRVLLDRRSPTAAVQIAAGACAEECCEKYADPFDPSQAADAARTAYERLRDS